MRNRSSIDRNGPRQNFDRSVEAVLSAEPRRLQLNLFGHMLMTKCMTHTTRIVSAARLC
jgi:hypothetical protein